MLVPEGTGQTQFQPLAQDTEEADVLLGNVYLGTDNSQKRFPSED